MTAAPPGQTSRSSVLPRDRSFPHPVPGCWYQQDRELSPGLPSGPAPHLTPLLGVSGCLGGDPVTLRGSNMEQRVGRKAKQACGSQTPLLDPVYTLGMPGRIPPWGCSRPAGGMWPRRDGTLGVLETLPSSGSAPETLGGNKEALGHGWDGSSSGGELSEASIPAWGSKAATSAGVPAAPAAASSQTQRGQTQPRARMGSRHSPGTGGRKGSGAECAGIRAARLGHPFPPPLTLSP